MPLPPPPAAASPTAASFDPSPHLDSLDDLVDAFQLWQLNPPASSNNMQRRGLNQPKEEAAARAAAMAAAQLRAQAGAAANGAPPPRLSLKRAAVKMVKKVADENAAPVFPPKPIPATPKPDHDANKATSDANLPSQPAVSTADLKDDLDARFARLMGKVTPEPPSAVQEQAAPVVAQNNAVRSESAHMPKIDVLPKSTANESKPLATAAIIDDDDFFRKADHYIASLPPSSKAPLNIDVLKAAVEALNKAVKSAKQSEVEEKYIGAAVDHVNKLPRNDGNRHITAPSLTQQLSRIPGSFVHLCAVLMDMDALDPRSLSDVVGLAKAIRTALDHGGRTDKAGVTDAAAESGNKPNGGIFTAWPQPAKRANIPGGRQVSLRSTLPIPTLNRLQALVWGGRVENFTFEAGKHIHHVRFMTADGCAKYFEDTENGINVPGEDTVVFVDRLPGSSSVNDLLHRIIDGGATRVIRVLDMGSEWTSEQLLSIARAKGRVVDKVVKGTAANNRPYAEFRFGSVYHAINFKRDLVEDDEFEHCTFIYGSDPCATHSGVHLED